MLSARTIAAAALVAFAGAAFGQVQPEAKKKLDEMIAAVKEARTLSFSTSLINTGVFSILPEMRGNVVMAREGGKVRMRVEGFRGAATNLDKNSKDLTYILVNDGEKTSWVDHEKKKVMERPNSARGNAEAVSTTDVIIPRELVGPEPFAELLNAVKLELEEPTSGDGVPCDIVAADCDKKGKYRIAIAQGDHLPRKVQRIIPGSLEVSQAWVLTSVKANVAVTEATWKLAVPEGFTVDSGPAPAPVRPAPGATGKPGTTTVVGPRPRSIGAGEGDMAPDFTLSGWDGSTVRLSDLRGNVVLLEFFGSWSPACKQAGPEVQKIADRYQGKPVKVYALAMREASSEAPAAFMREGRYTFGMLPAADEPAKLYRVRVHPTFFVVGKEGEIVRAVAGYKQEETPGVLTEAIDAALAGRAPAPPPSPTGGLTPAPAPAPGAPAEKARDKEGQPPQKGTPPADSPAGPADKGAPPPKTGSKPPAKGPTTKKPD